MGDLTKNIAHHDFFRVKSVKPGKIIFFVLKM